MKKRVLLVFVLLLALPVVFAGISFDPLESNEFNPGQSVRIAGTVDHSAAVQGFFELAVVCANGEFNLPKVALSLNPSERRSFPGDILIPKVSVSNAMDGPCRVRANLVENSVILATAESEAFEVSPRLVGEFQIDVERIQAGDSFELTGDVSRVNGDEVTGSAEVYFVSDGERFLADIVSFTDGSFEYTYESIGIPSGNYSITVVVNDVYGTSQEFPDIASFTLLSDLFVFAKVSSDSVDPGDSVRVSGEARTLLSDVVTDGTVFVSFANDTFSADVNDGSFNVLVPIPARAQSGSQKIRVRVEDVYRNVGTAEVAVDVVPVHSGIVVGLDQRNVTPGGRVVITPTVVDQAGDALDESVTVQVRDARGSVVREDVVASGSSVEFVLGPNAIPGSYEVRARSGNLDTRESFVVDTMVLLQFALEGQELLVENTGNVEYTSPVLVTYTADISEEHEVSILPNRVDRILLGVGIPSGTYDIVVSSGKFRQEFPGIVIEGIRLMNLAWLYWVLSVLVVVLMGVALYVSWRHERVSVVREEKVLRNYKKEIAVMKKKKETEKRPSSRYSFGNYDRDKIVQDYRKQVLKRLQDDSSKDKKGSLYGSGKKDDESRPFSMFD